MTNSSPPVPDEAPAPAVQKPGGATDKPSGSLSFWRRRLSRLLVGVGIALLASQFLPAMPKDQSLILRAPDGYRITHVELSYTSDGESLAGASLHPSEPTRSISHRVRAPDGEVHLSALVELKPHATELETGADGRVPVRVQRKLDFDGKLHELPLPPPRANGP